MKEILLLHVPAREINSVLSLYYLSLRRVIQIFKILNNVITAYLKEKLSPLRIHSLRNDHPNGFRERRTSTERHEHSFFHTILLYEIKLLENFKMK